MTEAALPSDPMELAVHLASQCSPEPDGTPHPRVGAVVVDNGEIVETAFRGEGVPEFGDHAEFIVLQKKLKNRNLSNAVLYTTLEPCITGRTPPKLACTKWILNRRIPRVIIGILDPNPNVCGKGEWLLLAYGVQVQRFPEHLQAEIRRLNVDFIDHQIAKLLADFDKTVTHIEVNPSCPKCDLPVPMSVRFSPDINHVETTCRECSTRFTVHTKRSGFYTTYRDESGDERYGVPPQVGFEFLDAIRWALVDRRQKGPFKGSQAWVDPEQFKRILRLLEHTQTTLGPGHSPKQLLSSMLQARNLPQYGVSREQVRSFFRLLTRAPRFPYFTFATRGSRGKTPYTNAFDASRAVRAYLDGFLYVLRSKEVLRSSEQARYAARLITRGTGIDVDSMATEIYERLSKQGLLSP